MYPGGRLSWWNNPVVTVAQCKYDSLWNCLLTGVGFGVDTLDGRLRNTVQESEAAIDC